MTDQTASGWTGPALLQKLRASAGPEGSAAVVFLHDDIADDQLDATAARAAAAAGGSTAVRIGEVSKLSRSANLQGDPDVIAAMNNQPGIKAILPADIPDSYPPPRRSGGIELS